MTDLSRRQMIAGMAAAIGAPKLPVAPSSEVVQIEQGIFGRTVIWRSEYMPPWGMQPPARIVLPPDRVEEYLSCMRSLRLDPVRGNWYRPDRPSRGWRKHVRREKARRK
jgi:hypothetical protein